MQVVHWWPEQSLITQENPIHQNTFIGQKIPCNVVASVKVFNNVQRFGRHQIRNVLNLIWLECHHIFQPVGIEHIAQSASTFQALGCAQKCPKPSLFVENNFWVSLKVACVLKTCSCTHQNQNVAWAATIELVTCCRVRAQNRDIHMLRLDGCQESKEERERLGNWNITEFTLIDVCNRKIIFRWPLDLLFQLVDGVKQMVWWLDLVKSCELNSRLVQKGQFALLLQPTFTQVQHGLSGFQKAQVCGKGTGRHKMKQDRELHSKGRSQSLKQIESADEMNKCVSKAMQL